MANANINLPYGVTKSIRVVGENASNSSERPITNITFGSGGMAVIAATADPNVFTVVNNNVSGSGTGFINWSAKNELNQTISGQTPITLIPADPAVTIQTFEL